MAKAYGDELLKKTAEQSFWNSFLTISDPFDGLVFRKTSTQATDTYARLGAAPMPEEWVGDAHVKDANEYDYSVTNKAWKSAVRIDKKLIKYQQWDEIANLVANLGAKARAHQVKKLSDQLELGFTTTGDDGQNFFDTDHADPGAEYTTDQDNDLTADITTPADPTAANVQTAIRAIIDAFYGFKDDRGDPFDLGELDQNNLVIMIPPTYFSVFRQVMTTDTISAAGDNDLMGHFQIRVNRFLTNTDRFYAMVNHVNHKPLILQESGGLVLENNMGSDDHQMTGDVIYSAHWWGETAFGQWRTAVGYVYT